MDYSSIPSRDSQGLIDCERSPRPASKSALEMRLTLPVLVTPLLYAQSPQSYATQYARCYCPNRRRLSKRKCNIGQLLRVRNAIRQYDTEKYKETHIDWCRSLDWLGPISR